jgi:restriction endonuclease S subunit
MTKGNSTGKINLNQLTVIKTGLVLSRYKASLQSEFKKIYNVISLKSFNENGIYDHSYTDNFESNRNIEDEHLIKKGDILFRLREPNNAIYIDKDYKNIIVPSLIIIIRVVNNNINPIYLTHYLNSSAIRKQLFKDMTIGRIPMTKVKDMKDLLIDVPPLETQEKIASTQQLANKEIKLLKNLILEKEQYRKSIFEKIIN